ncbi:MAG: flagellar hook-length control protein FliK [Candidatus Methylomirabilales bacterium]
MIPPVAVAPAEAPVPEERPAAAAPEAVALPFQALLADGTPAAEGDLAEDDVPAGAEPDASAAVPAGLMAALLAASAPAPAPPAVEAPAPGDRPAQPAGTSPAGATPGAAPPAPGDVQAGPAPASGPPAAPAPDGAAMAGGGSPLPPAIEPSPAVLQVSADPAGELSPDSASLATTTPASSAWPANSAGPAAPPAAAVAGAMEPPAGLPASAASPPGNSAEPADPAAGSVASSAERPAAVPAPALAEADAQSGEGEAPAPPAVPAPTGNGQPRRAVGVPGPGDAPSAEPRAADVPVAPQAHEAAGDGRIPSVSPLPRRETAGGWEGGRHAAAGEAEATAHPDIQAVRPVLEAAVRADAPAGGPGPRAADGRREPTLAPVNLPRVVAAVRRAWESGLEVGLTLYPESLGEVRVRLRWVEGTLSARLDAASPAAREALAGGLPTLRVALEEQGLPVSSLRVGTPMDGHAGWDGRHPGAPRTPAWIGRRAEAEARLGEASAWPARPGPGRLDVRI